MNELPLLSMQDELEKIAKLSMKQKAGLAVGGGLLSALLLRKGYKGMFPKKPAKGPMYSYAQALDNLGNNRYTIGDELFLTGNDLGIKVSTRAKEAGRKVQNYGGAGGFRESFLPNRRGWVSSQKAGPFPLVEVRRAMEKDGGTPIWVANVHALTKDRAGRWSGTSVKQARRGMFTDKQKEEFAREAYEYAKKMNRDYLKFPKWNSK